MNVSAQIRALCFATLPALRMGHLRDSRPSSRRHASDRRLDRTKQRVHPDEFLYVEVPGAGEDDLRLRRGGRRRYGGARAAARAA
jgi:hypothetical protein